MLPHWSNRVERLMRSGFVPNMREEVREEITTIKTERGELPIRKLIPPIPDLRLLLAHGAGAGMDSPFMSAMQKCLAQNGVLTICFNFSYIQMGRKMPGPAKRLTEEFRLVLEKILAEDGDQPLFLGGKSMGGRIASYVAGDYARVAGLIFLGYPLHAPGKPGLARAEHLYILERPMLFISGDRDRLAEISLIQQVVARIGKRAVLYPVPDGDHSLKVPKRSGRATEEVWRESCLFAAQWMRRIAQGIQSSGENI